MPEHTPPKCLYSKQFLFCLSLLIGGAVLGCGASSKSVDDYVHRTLLVTELFVGKPSIAKKVLKLHAGNHLGRLEFKGDYEVIELITDTKVFLSFQANDGSVAIKSQLQRKQEKLDSNRFVITFELGVAPEFKGKTGCVEVYGKDQILLLRKYFEVYP